MLEEDQHLREASEEWILEDILKEYCRNDVNLLREGCEMYRKEFITMWGLDPLVSAITGASATHLAFRKNYLKPDSILVLSDHGLQPETHYLAMANGWLAWIMQKDQVEIQCALNGKERKVGSCHLDGYLGTNQGEFPLRASYPSATGYVAFEFYGCLFHGHQECMGKNKKDPWGRSMAERWQKTLQREQFLKREGFHIVRKWECHFRREIDDDPELKEFMATNNFMKPPSKASRRIFWWQSQWSQTSP